MKPIKVYGGNYAGTHSCVIAATSQAEAVRLLNEQGANLSIGYFRDFFSVTSNPESIAKAMSEPGRGFKRSNRGIEQRNAWERMERLK